MAGNTTVTGIDAYSDEWTTAPDDGGNPTAEDIRAVAQIALSNGVYLFNRRKQLPVVWVYDVEDPPFTFYQFSGTSYADPSSDGYVDIPDTVIGDIIIAMGMFLCENQGAVTGLGSRVRLAAVDDFTGTPTSDIPIPGARAYIETTSGDMVPVTLIGQHVVTAAGATRIKVQGRVNAGGEFMRIQSVAQIIAELQPPSP